MSQPIPQPPGIPLLGNILDISPSNPWASIKKLTEEHGEIFQVKILGKTLVFVASVALAEELCDETRFRKLVGGPIIEIRAAVHDSLFTAFDHEPSWGRAHRIIAPHLSVEAIKTRVFTNVRDATNELITKWTKRGAHVTSPLKELQRLDLECVTYALFGTRLNNIDGPEHVMLQAMEDSTSEAMMRPNRPGLLNLLHAAKFNNANKTMRDWATKLLQDRKDNPAPQSNDDLLSALMHSEDPITKKKLTESEIIDEIVTMPIGSSTAPCLLATAIYLLIQSPAAISRARQELDATVAPNADLTPQDLDKLEYVQGIVRESLRLSFAAPGFNIEPIPSDSKAPILLQGGKYQIPHNQPMLIALAGVNRDPSVFEDPLAFKPERMTGTQFEKLPAGAKKWFGNGKRECIGKHFAWQWSVLVLASLLRTVDFEMADPAYVVHQDGWFNYRLIGFEARVKPRK